MDIPLTNSALLFSIDDEDAEKVLALKWCSLKGYVRSTTTNNGKRWPDGQYISVMRLIMGSPPRGQEWDHADRNKLNNRKANLRLATRSQNMQNVGPRRSNRCGLKGVTGTKYGRWVARISKDGKRRTIGVFSTKEEAACAYDAAAKKLFGKFAYLNF